MAAVAPNGRYGAAMTESPRRLRSRSWFDRQGEPDTTALYVEHYLNYGLTLDELRSGAPIIGIAQTGSDLTPCNRHHRILAERVREGIRTAGGIAMEFPIHTIQETGKRPTPMLDRNLMYLSCVEMLYGYPLDGVVLTIGCDKTTPAQLMAAATVDIPAIALSVGPMLSGWLDGKRIGTGTIIWRARQMLAAGEIDERGFIELVARSTPSPGWCNTMGTATTMNSLCEALGMSLPGSAVIPAVLAERSAVAYATGLRIVQMVREDLRPSQIFKRQNFLNAIVTNSALGGSTNAPIHLAAIARHAGVELSMEDWQQSGLDVPLLVNLQPAGEYLGEDFHRAGGVPTVMAELLRAGLLDGGTLSVSGRTLAENLAGARVPDGEVIRPLTQPLAEKAGFVVLSGNLFDAAIMKTSVIKAEFRDRYLSNPDDPDAFEGTAFVFDGPEDYHRRIDMPGLGIDDRSILVIRGCGPVGYPGAPEVVNMRPPAALIEQGIHDLPCIGDGRQSGTSGSPSILNASPEAAVGGGLALLRTGDRVRVDLRRRRCDALVPPDEWERRRAELDASGGFPIPASQTPWQEIYRRNVGQMSHGAILEGAERFQRVDAAAGLPRDSH
jgi:dihydroxy-acid dehydratase